MQHTVETQDFLSGLTSAKPFKNLLISFLLVDVIGEALPLVQAVEILFRHFQVLPGNDITR